MDTECIMSTSELRKLPTGKGNRARARQRAGRSRSRLPVRGRVLDLPSIRPRLHMIRWALGPDLAGVARAPVEREAVWIRN